MKNINKLISDNIDIWSSAVQNGKSTGRGKSKKRTLQGVKKLRELILELAVHGKLVPQNKSDVKATKLLERITEEKQKLIKKKLVKKPKVLPVITQNEEPFSLPSSWVWCRLQDISFYIQRGKGPKYDDNGKVKVISQKCIQWSGFDIEPARYVNDESLEKYQEERYLQPNDLLWNSTGTGTVGRINVLGEIASKSLVADSHVTVIRSLLPNPHFIWIYISAPGIQLRIDPGHENALVSGSTNQVELNTSSVTSLEVPLPPLEEQNRIVAKVEDLMTLCDQLEQQTEASIDAHQLLVKELLSTLTNSQNAEEFEQNWARISEHFDLLFTTEHSIEQLKQTILQLGVMGKLVPQNLNDEPASKLLERIAQEKKQLIKDKVIKKQKILPELNPNKLPYIVPDNWIWCNLQDVCSYIQRGKGPKYDDAGKVKVISQKCIQWSGFDLAKARHINDKSLEKYQEERFLQAYDLLWNSTGTGTVGRINVLEKVKEKTLVADSHVTVIRTLIPASYFIWAYIASAGVQNRIEPDHEDSLVSGSTKQVELNTSSVVALEIPLPPIDEQKRIINKIDELIAKCDSLKELIRESQTTLWYLAAAITDSALGRPLIIKLEQTEEKKAMKISTELSLGSVAYDKTAILAPLISDDGADAKTVWSKSGLDLPNFYKQLKSEITAGFVAKPAKAEIEG